MSKRKQGGSAPTSPPTAAEVNYLELSFAKVPIFSACSPEELLRVAGLCAIGDADPGEAIVAEGDVGFDFYVILNGDAVVTRSGVEVGRLTAGDFFGELALFDPAPRNATVTAVGDLTVAVLSKPAFREVLQDAPVRERVPRDGAPIARARRQHLTFEPGYL
jgi:CRP-like cAMP-binding protein